MIGVAGGNCFPSAPSPWWSNSHFCDHLVNVRQHWPKKKPKQTYNTPTAEDKQITNSYNNPTGENSVLAATVDGLFFCIRRSILTQIKFDEKTFSGFHCYDTDISLQVSEIAEVRVVFDVLVEHFSDANANRDFYNSCVAHYRKWRTRLPIIHKAMSTATIEHYNKQALLDFCYTLRSSGFFNDSEIRKLITEVMGSEKTPLNDYLGWQLWNWSFFGYELARYPNFIARILWRTILRPFQSSL